MVWCMAKTANPETPPIIEWIDSFEYFPLMDIVGEVQDLLINSVVGVSKRKN